MVKNTDATFADISLKELLLLALKQWRKILCVGIILMILSGVFYFSYEKPKKLEQIKTLESEIQTLQLNIDRDKNYYYNLSIFYKLPSPFYQGNLIFMVKNTGNNTNTNLEKSIIVAYMANLMPESSIYSEINKSLIEPLYDPYFLYQVITTECNYEDGTNTFTIKLKHYNLDKSNEILNIIVKILQDRHQTINQNVGSHELILINKSINQVYNTNVINKVNEASKSIEVQESNLKQKQNNLFELQKSHNIILSLLEYMGAGLFGGSILFYIFYCLYYLFSSKVKTVNQLRYNYSVESLGNIINDSKNKFDNLISKKLGNPVDISFEEMIKIVSINISALNTNSQKILILGSENINETDKWLLTLLQNNNLKDYNIDFAKNAANRAETLEKISNSEAVIIVVKKLKTSLIELEMEFKIITSYGKKIIGVILVE